MVYDEMRNFVCKKCGATNVGIQKACLICGAGMIPEPPIAKESPPAVPDSMLHGSPLVSCPHCGAKNSGGAQFCGSCGEMLNPVQHTQKRAAFCTKCGAVIRENSLFCTKCGTPVRSRI